MNRREFIVGATATASLMLAADAPALGPPPPWVPPEGPGLNARARRTGRVFGCALKSSQIAKDPELVAAALREAGGVVHEYEFKRYITQPEPGRLDFVGTDAVIDFARAHDMQARGHTLIWYAGNPPWLEATLPKAASAARERLMTDYIRTAMRRYGRSVGEWDVVNEPVEPDEGAPDGMRRKNIWSNAFGERYIDQAFHLARETDPTAVLFLTDFGLEHDSPRCEKRRTAILKLLDRLQSRSVPIDAFGIQGHLKPFREGFDQRIFANFLDELTGRGLQVSITEFDLADRWGPVDVARRDAEIAAIAKAFLDVSMSYSAMRGLYCWGLSDRYSWLSTYPEYRWPDGKPSRGLPLDADMRRKPLWGAIAAAFDAAAPRSEPARPRERRRRRR